MEQIQGARLGLNTKPNTIQTVFSIDVMQQVLPFEIIKEFEAAQQGHQRLSINALSKIADALKIWALEHGATHFSHWFMPLRSTIGIKKESFAECLAPSTTIINLFSAYNLLVSEADGSSLPNGNLRQPTQTRTYGLWDIFNPPFLEKTNTHTTLYIPSLLYSVDAKALDYKIPLLRSQDRLTKAATQLLQLLDKRAQSIVPTLTTEQDLFLIDEALAAQRPDLENCERTIFGAPAVKDQQFHEAYYAPVDERRNKFFEDLDQKTRQAGIIIKARHHEVAPNQFKVIVQSSRSTQACSQNTWLMELIKTTAHKYGLRAILHEKPFQGINGSGKNCRWSLTTDMGLNLFDPANDEGKGVFALFLVAIIKAISTHNGLFRAVAGSYGNDFRLGTNDAPPTIMALHLGQGITEYLREYDLATSKIFLHRTGLSNNQLPFKDIVIDLTDRNRTSPLAFSEDKFEFRALGSSSHTAHAITIFNAAVAQAIEQLTEELQEALAVKPRDAAISELVRSTLRRHDDIICNGSNYSSSWQQEAHDRDLHNYHTSYEAFVEYENQTSIDLLKGVLNPDELNAHKKIFTELYEITALTEARTALKIFYQLIVPACTKYLQQLCQTSEHLKTTQISRSNTLLMDIITHIDEHLAHAQVQANKLETLVQESAQTPEPLAIREVLKHLRDAVDALEKYFAPHDWPLPTYDQLLRK